MKVAATALAALLAFVILIAVLVKPHKDAHQHKSPKNYTELAARINSACKRGDYVQDFTTGDEYTPVPAGMVKVTCVKKSDQSLYYRAVAR